jgi:predicted DNA-binding transcriptional regulator AlpA
MQQSTYIPDTTIARRYGVSRATVWRWVKNGQLPAAVKLSPGCTRWKLAEIEAWEQSREGGSK